VGGKISTTIAVVMSLFHLYAAYAIVPTQELRYTHVAFTLVLSFCCFRWRRAFATACAGGTSSRHRRGRDIVYALWGGDDFTDRATMPDRWDVIVGIVFIVLAAGGDAAHDRRDHALVSLLFIAYAMLGPICRRPGPIAATTSPAWSVTSSLPWRAFSASPSTCRRR
jgi:TRAP-type uncharacterized transport system fused permease subunit